MIYALLAIAAVMAASCLFGYAMHDVINKTSKQLIDANTNATKHNCDTCKNKKLTWFDEPCSECDSTFDRWEEDN